VYPKGYSPNAGAELGQVSVAAGATTETTLGG